MSVSPIFIQFIPSSDSVKNCFIGLGDPPLAISNISSNLTHSQLSGISNGFSSSVISGSGLLFLIFFSLQQFTAFKPLAHRPKPMLAKP